MLTPGTVDEGQYQSTGVAVAGSDADVRRVRLRIIPHVRAAALPAAGVSTAAGIVRQGDPVDDVRHGLESSRPLSTDMP